MEDTPILTDTQLKESLSNVRQWLTDHNIDLPDYQIADLVETAIHPDLAEEDGYCLHHGQFEFRKGCPECEEKNARPPALPDAIVSALESAQNLVDRIESVKRESYPTNASRWAVVFGNGKRYHAGAYQELKDALRKADK